MSKIVRTTLGESRLTGEEIARLETLANRPDREVDLSDIPELTEEFWENAVTGRFYRPAQEEITVPIDTDVLAWLHRKEEGDVRKKLNAVLREAMLKAIEGERKRA